MNSFIHLELTIDSGNKYYYKIFESEDRPLIFANWINKNGLPKKDLKVGALEKIKGYNYPVFLLFNQALTDIEKNNKVSDGFYPRTILSRVFKNEAVWLAPIRTEPQRTYADFKTTFNPNGSHSPYVLKKIILNDSHESVRNGINKFGQESGLFEKLEILSYDNSDTSPFEVRICINGNSLKITNVGYGISQILPIVTEIIARPQHTWFAIQQPEIHLHPKAQAAFGEFIFSSLPDHKNFIIETHSDYLIDRFRLCTNRANNVKGESQIVFFQRTDKGNNITIIPINQDGSYPDDQPIEFREFFIKEQIDLLSI
ncbi:MAG: AAA family ATPase [Taibaiella sp.]|nr:AAA family ATPase [Taibaiella sp.]